jgi:predicted nucleic acid-binding protein
MNRYIVDASVTIQFFIVEPHTEHARALFQGLTEEDEVIVPEFCLLECTNILWKKVRFQGMSEATANALVDDLIALPVTVVGSGDYLKRGLAIGLKHQLALYDSIYIALAEGLGYPLVTDDTKQAAAAQAEGITLKPLTDFKPA